MRDSADSALHYCSITSACDGCPSSRGPIGVELHQMNLAKRLYRGGRPNWLASVANQFSAALHSLGIAPNYLVTLEVRGRRSGRTFRLPLVMVVVAGERYLVSMLRPDAAWVQNAKQPVAT